MFQRWKFLDNWIETRRQKRTRDYNLMQFHPIISFVLQREYILSTFEFISFDLEFGNRLPSSSVSPSFDRSFFFLSLLYFFTFYHTCHIYIPPIFFIPTQKLIKISPTDRRIFPIVASIIIFSRAIARVDTFSRYGLFRGTTLGQPSLPPTVSLICKYEIPPRFPNAFGIFRLRLRIPSAFVFVRIPSNLWEKGNYARLQERSFAACVQCASTGKNVERGRSSVLCIILESRSRTPCDELRIVISRYYWKEPFPPWPPPLHDISSSNIEGSIHLYFLLVFFSSKVHSYDHRCWLWILLHLYFITSGYVSFKKVKRGWDENWQFCSSFKKNVCQVSFEHFSTSMQSQWRISWKAWKFSSIIEHDSSITVQIHHWIYKTLSSSPLSHCLFAVNKGAHTWVINHFRNSWKTWKPFSFLSLVKVIRLRRDPQKLTYRIDFNFERGRSKSGFRLLIRRYWA